MDSEYLIYMIVGLGTWAYLGSILADHISLLPY